MANGQIGPPNNAQFSPNAMTANQNQALGGPPQAGGVRDFSTPPPAPAPTPVGAPPGGQAGGQRDYSGGNDYLKGLNYTTQPTPPAAPAAAAATPAPQQTTDWTYAKGTDIATSSPLTQASSGAVRPDGVPEGAMYWNPQTDTLGHANGQWNYGFTAPTGPYAGNDPPPGGAPPFQGGAMGPQSTRDQLQTPQTQQQSYPTTGQGSTGNIPGQPMQATSLGIPGGIEPQNGGAPAGTPSNNGSDPSLQQNQIQGATQTTGQLGARPTTTPTLNNNQIQQLLAQGFSLDQIQQGLQAYGTNGAQGSGQPPFPAGGARAGTPTGPTGPTGTAGSGAPPNTYGGPFNQPTYQQGTIPSNMFSGNNGPSQYPTAAPINGFGIQPSLSPQLTGNYFNYLNSQVGQGATPYGQQSVFMPGFGQTSQQGLTAPIDPQLQASTGAINSTLGGAQSVLGQSSPQTLAGQYGPIQSYMNNVQQQANNNYVNPAALQQQYQPLLNSASGFAQNGGVGAPGSQLSSQAQFGAQGNAQDPNGLYTGAQAFQNLASGSGFLGAPGDYLTSATNSGGYGTPGDLQTKLATSGQLGGQGNSTLNSMAQNGNPIDQTQPWQLAVQAMQRNQQQNQAQIAERSAQSGNLAGGAAGGGTGYNQAMTDYMTQANAQQNALLAQMMSQSQENAANRQLSAAGTLQGGQIGAISNLSAAQQNAGLYGAGAQFQGANAQQQLMQGALGQQNQNQQFGQQQGLQGLSQSQYLPYNLSNQSVNTMLNAGQGGLNTTNSALTNPYAAYNQTLGNVYNGQQQSAQQGQYYQNLDQASLDRNAQEFMRTQAEYNPLNQQLYGGSVTFPGMLGPQATSGIGAAIGQVIGGALNTYKP